MTSIAALRSSTGHTISDDFRGATSGAIYRLAEALGSGGEGTVHALNVPNRAAKVYRRRPDRELTAKLHELVDAGDPELMSLAAWPLEVLTDRSGAVVGYVMPRITAARGLHDLYHPRSRLQHFPQADFRFLVHTAANLARVFASLHDKGFIIGDVNHGNVLVCRNGTVAAIDCDSFQIGDGGRYCCGVGVDLFTPPELQGCDLARLPRTTNHDAFGLAVLIFHVLFMGRHPFAGVWQSAGEMSIVRAITEGRFAYSRDTQRTQMLPPPFSLPLDSIGPVVTELFERAFHPDGRIARPRAEDWIEALDTLRGSLVTCTNVGWHQHASTASACPWCDIENKSRAQLFGGVSGQGLLDLDQLWQTFEAVADIGSAPALPREEDWKSPSGHPHRKRRKLALGVALATIPASGTAATINAACAILVLLAGALAIIVLARPKRRPVAEREQLLDAFVRADHAWQALVQEWQAQTSEAEFQARKASILALKHKIDGLGVERQARLAAIAGQVVSEQRLAYLRQHRIADADLYNIGPARLAILHAHGFETAADLDKRRLSNIAGFGSHLVFRLMLWRRQLEDAFDRARTNVENTAQRLRIDKEIARRRAHLVTHLRGEIAQLKALSARIISSRTRLWPRLEAAFAARMHAKHAYDVARGL